MPRAILIADDLTGAMDTGLQFSKRGLDTLVSMSWQRLPQQAEVAVLDTDSRAATASVAYGRLRRVGELVREALGGQPARIYKKVDSTMRGNVGYELRALYEVLQPRAVVVAPAFPRSGRTTVRGRQCVDGHQLELTFFAHDPRWPMQQSHLPTLLMQQSGYEIGQLSLEELAAGPDAAASALRARSERIIVCDARTDDHLATIAQALAILGPAWLPCGSAGLAEPWADAIGLRSASDEAEPPQASAPLLFVSGSRNETTVAQLGALIADTAPMVVQVDPYASYDLPGEVSRLLAAVRQSLANGHDVVLQGTLAPFAPGAGPMVARVLAQTVARLGRETAAADRPGGLFLTGGDIAVAVCHELAVDALRILHEVQPGIPGGVLLGGLWDGLRVVTKAGGFGNQQALIEAGTWLRGARRSRP